MPAEKPMAVSSQDIIMKSEEPDDFLDIFNRQSIRKESFTPSQRVENSVVEWIQLLKDLGLQDLPGMPFPAPLKVHVQRCDKCSQEFISPINYRRHIHVHHRMKKTDKGSSNIRDPLGAFWDKLSVEKAREVVSFDNVFLEEVPGSSVIKELTKLVRNSVLPALPRVYWGAGSALLDIVEISSSTSPLSSQELFSILDDASEKTFLCGTADLVQRYMFDGGAQKIGLEIENLVACTSFLFEQKLVKEWLAEKEAEALRLQKMLLEEEEAVQKRQQKRRQKKLRQKERKAKEQKTVDTAEIEDSVGDSSEVALPTETSSSSATSDRDRQNSKDSVAKDQGPVDTADSVAKDQGPVDTAVIKDSVGDSLEVLLPTETSNSSATSDRDRQNSKDSVAKDQGPVDTAVIKDSVGDSLEVLLPTETSSFSATSGRDGQNSDTLPDTDPSIEPVQFSKNEEDVDGESQVTSSSGCDAGRGQDVERQMVQGSGHRHMVGDQQHAPIRSQREISSGFRPPKFGGKQKHVTIRERAIPGYGNIMRRQKSKSVDDVGSLKTGAHAETIDQPAEEKVNVVLIGSLPVKLYHHKSSSVAEAQDCSLVEHQIPKRNNLPEKPSKPESVRSGYQSTGKCWRPVSHGSRSVVPGNIGVKEFDAEVIAEKSADQTSSSEGCLISDATEVVNTPESQYEFDVNAAREYLAQTWKEVLEGGEYTILILDSDSESPRNAAAQTESPDSPESGSTDNEENRASVGSVVETSAGTAAESQVLKKA
ncbi:hypothetical protein SLEP1_g39890 [Rubroshorea leprosula]|uniref:C2H2-type domain-containing protein n=1 Tax=Rubroshorea leprosula TaxID=152421 RepID=A0AAV5L2J7_9ROSI|nr:hypothetical protein SLEP1_g39890 [Rubroshorea leprosula]